jgi:SAM-dependent methyltransferase
MCHESCLEFGERVIQPEHVRGLRVLEVGSQNINGSLRSKVQALGPGEYLGVDMHRGLGVDAVCDATQLVPRFGCARWDLVISTEMLEHVWDWPAVVSNLKRSLSPLGHLLVTTRSVPFFYHPYPEDYWRFDLVDIATIFSDLQALTLEPDHEAPGVFFYACRPACFIEEPADLALFNMKEQRRVPFKEVR